MCCVDLRTARIRRSNNEAEDDGKDSQLDATEGTKAATKRKRPPKQNATEESTSKTESKSNTQQKSKPGSENKTATRSDRVVPGKSAAVRKPAAAKKQGDSVPKKKPAAAKPETPRKVMGEDDARVRQRFRPKAKDDPLTRICKILLVKLQKQKLKKLRIRDPSDHPHGVVQCSLRPRQCRGIVRGALQLRKRQGQSSMGKLFD